MPMLSVAEAAKLRTWHRSVRRSATGMTFDYTSEDRELVRITTDRARRLVEPRLEGVLRHHRVLFATMVVKHGEQPAAMRLHDDRTHVPEPCTRSVVLWIPLVDVSPEAGNGTLHVLPRSHRATLRLAGTSTPEWHLPYESSLMPHVKPITLRAGDAVAYDSRLLHGSYANRSGSPREAIVCAVVPRDAPTWHVRSIDGRRQEIYEVDDEFFLGRSPSSLVESFPSTYPLVREVEVPPIDPGRLAELWGGPIPVPTAACPPGLALDPSRRETAGPPSWRVRRQLERVATAQLPVSRLARWGPVEQIDLSPASAHVLKPAAAGSTRHVIALDDRFEVGMVGAADGDGQVRTVRARERIDLEGGSEVHLWNDGADPISLLVLTLGP